MDAHNRMEASAVKRRLALLVALSISVYFTLHSQALSNQDKGGENLTASHSDLAPLFFNQEFVEGRYPRLRIEDVESVFKHIFSRLPPEVYVYPTENYYYFAFVTDGRYMMGNFRLSPEDRDSGYLHFAYFEFGKASWWQYKRFESRDGVFVRRIKPLRYGVTYRDKSVVFQLNTLNQTLPRSFKLYPREAFVGRSFDESGFQFLLLYNKERRHFMWVLDPKQPVPLKFEKLDNNLRLHRRSGFLFYHDVDNGRKMLIGVDSQNVELNNYYDGPFDQLPDNFIAETPFSEYVQEAYPYTQGRIDPHGRFVIDGNAARMAITPYGEYNEVEGLTEYVASCIEQTESKALLYECICHDSKVGLAAEAEFKGGIAAEATISGEVR